MVGIADDDGVERLEQFVGFLEMSKLNADQCLADDRFQMTRLKRKRPIEALYGLFMSLEHQLGHAAVAVGIGIVGFQPDGTLVSFDRLVHWAKPQILVALDSAALSGAPALAETLKSETQAAGFTPDLKPFHAHVTVARKVAHAHPAQPLPPILWSTDAFALIESRTEPAGPVYSVIESYLLAKAEKAHE